MMKATGIVRKVDDLGRVVIPKELRRTSGIDEGDSLEIYTEGDSIVIQPYKTLKQCAVTGKISEDNITLENGMVLSEEGIKIIQDQLKFFDKN